MNRSGTGRQGTRRKNGSATLAVYYQCPIKRTEPSAKPHSIATREQFEVLGTDT